jgi:C4-dicarboxylate-specific signal transduction histidine kinase
MTSLRNISIKSKLLMVYITITGLILTSAFFIIMRMDQTSTRQNVISGLAVVGEIVADRCTASVAFSDVESANSNLRALRSHESIVYACIRTDTNQPFAQYAIDSSTQYKCDDFSLENSTRFNGNYVDIYKPILLEGHAIGMLQVKASLDELNERLMESARLSVLVFAGLMLIAAFLSRKLMNMVTQPITRLKDIAQSVTEKRNYDLRMDQVSNDEVGVLVNSFNKMLDQIAARDRALNEEKEKAEISALSAKRHASETEKMNVELEKEIGERLRVEKELQELNETLEEKVQERTAELKQLNQKIGDIARSAGMAEVASGVLHNVGNVLNSVNVSASVMREQVRKSKAENLGRLVNLMQQHQGDLAEFITQDEKGKQIPKFISLLSEQLTEERNILFKELDELANNIDHIKNIISMQQSYAGSYGVREKVKLSDLVEDALKINLQEVNRHNIKVERQYDETPLIYADKHKLLQIIINLISNAKNALKEKADQNRLLQIMIYKSGSQAVIEIRDTGVGIAEDDMQHLFEYGFKRRQGGHGFGLHHSALVANELGGRIKVYSEGPGQGATFQLFVPLDEKVVAA